MPSLLRRRGDPTAGVADYSRLDAMCSKRSISMTRLRVPLGERSQWPMRRVSEDRALGQCCWLQANALERGKSLARGEGRRCSRALAIAPEQPLLLNFMGYAKLERGEDMDSAEAMIRKASEFAPDDASIIELRWAGPSSSAARSMTAIATLQQSGGKGPGPGRNAGALGDALYKSGRRYEARFAWNAALVTAEDKIAQRVKSKLASGLTTADAAP